MKAIAGHLRLPGHRIFLAITALLLGAGAAVAAATPAHATVTACSVHYNVTTWKDGFYTGMQVTNLGDPDSIWTIRFTFAQPPGGQRILSGWSGIFYQNGQDVIVINTSWNGAVATGATVGPGFQAANPLGGDPVPKDLTFNGATCTVVT